MAELSQEPRQRNVFVIALDDFNHSMLKRIRGAEAITFHPLLEVEDVLQPDYFEFNSLLERAEDQLAKFDGPVDAVVGYFDFPTSDMEPILRKRRNLTAQSIECVVRCEHKYWSRVCQKEVAPECVPDFALVDPTKTDASAEAPLEFPFWIKPVKSFSSYLGFRVDNQKDFDLAIEQMRRHQKRLAEPFNVLLEHVEMPQELAHVDGNYAIAESIIEGDQCTLEGYMQDGECYCYAAVDSIRGLPDSPSSFTAYSYPSRLPREVLDRMADVAERVMRRIGYDNACFNIEFFYDEARDKVWLLEINPRLSKSHAPLLEMVDGSSHQEIAVQLALGQRPYLAPHRGRYARACKFMLRRKEDAFVHKVPSAEEIQKAQREVPGTRFLLEAKAGKNLSDAWEQDSYSFEYGVMFVGGETLEEIQSKKERLLSFLRFEFEEPTSSEPTSVQTPHPRKVAPKSQTPTPE